MSFNVGDRVRTIPQSNSAGGENQSFVGVVVTGSTVYVQIAGTPMFEPSTTPGKYTWVSLFTDASETNQQKYPVLLFTAGLELA
jgi:hypothetical protein